MWQGLLFSSGRQNVPEMSSWVLMQRKQCRQVSMRFWVLFKRGRDILQNLSSRSRLSKPLLRPDCLPAWNFCTIRVNSLLSLPCRVFLPQCQRSGVISMPLRVLHIQGQSSRLQGMSRRLHVRNSFIVPRSLR
jgi:hypothetical protein